MIAAQGQQNFADLIKEVVGLGDEQLKQALRVQKETNEPLAQILVNMGLMTEKDKAKCLGRQWSIPYVDLAERPPDKEIQKLVPRHLMQRLRAVPLQQNGRRLVVAMANPLDIYAIDQLRLVTGLEVEPVIAGDEDISNAVAQDVSAGEELGQALQQVQDELGSRLVAMRLVRDLMRLGFLLERQYAPYIKWLGTAFQRLDCARVLTPLFERIMRACALFVGRVWLSQ